MFTLVFQNPTAVIKLTKIPTKVEKHHETEERHNYIIAYIIPSPTISINDMHKN